MNNKNDQEITPEQLTALQKIFNNPDMTKEQAGHKVQAVRLHKQVLNEVRLKAVDSVNLIKMINDDNKPLKPNFQINIINVAIKIGLVTMLILNFNNSASMSFGYYHFLSLYGTVCFLIACFIEYNRQNYILTVVAFIGLITYQPIYSVLKYDVYLGEVTTYWIIIQSTFIVVTLWIIFDLIRWIVDYRKFKKQSI